MSFNSDIFLQEVIEMLKHRRKNGNTLKEVIMKDEVTLYSFYLFKAGFIGADK